MSSQPELCDEFKDRTDDLAAWVAHVNSRECQKCLELARYSERESQKSMFAWAHRN
jgi:hypothetical protein